MNKLFEYDKKILKLHSANYICGIDEVGRGCLAGDVFATAVIMKYDNVIEEINDSKKLTKKQRESIYKKFVDNVIEYKTASINVETIEKINIFNATKLCMQNALKLLSITPDIVLVDYVDIGLGCIPITHGDAISYAIACASIIAKVERDQYMFEQSKKYSNYGFETNMGYGTKKHIEAIKKYGICNIHRKSFLKNFFNINSNNIS